MSVELRTSGTLATLCIGIGALVVVQPVAAVAACALLVLAAVAVVRAERLGWDLVLIALAGSLILGYGFANLGVPGGLPLPLADLILVFLLGYVLLTWPLRTIDFGPPFFFGGTLLLFATARLFFDYPVWGSNALRDYALPLELGYLVIGYWSMSTYGLERWQRALKWIFGVSAAYLALYPVRDAVAALSPTVGLQRPVPLFGTFSHSGTTASLGFIFVALNWRNTRARLPLALCFLAVLGLDQSRGIYVAVPVALAVVLFVSSGKLNWIRSDLVRAGAITAVSIVVLFAFVPLPGRLGSRVTWQFAVSQVGTLAGHRGPGSGTLETRKQFNADTFKHVRDVPHGWVWGVGLGPDLTNGFRVANNANVRKPHDDYLEMYARLGVIGLALFIATLVSAAGRILGAARRATVPDEARFLTWVIGGSVVILIVAATQPLLAFPYGTIPLFLPMGAALAVADRVRRDRTHAHGP